MNLHEFLIVCPLVFLAGFVDAIAGHYLGAHMVVKNGVKIIKPIILLVLALLLIKIVLGI